MIQRRQAALDRLGPGPFTRAQALAAGFTGNDLRSGAVETLTTGVYVAAPETITHETRCAAATLIAPTGSHIAGASAAQLWGLPVPHHDQVTVSVPPKARLRRPEYRVLHHSFSHNTERQHVTALYARSCGRRILVSRPEQTLVESRELSLVDAVVLADAILAFPGVSPASARTMWSEAADPRVRSIAAWAEENVASAMESRTRLLAVMGGAPLPVVQHEVWVPSRRRFDFAWPQYQVAGEYDGSYHYATEEQKQRDLLRDEELRRAGWEIVRVVSVGIYRDPASTVARFRRALAARGCPLGPGLEWRQHFPQLVRAAA